MTTNEFGQSQLYSIIYNLFVLHRYLSVFFPLLLIFPLLLPLLLTTKYLCYRFDYLLQVFPLLLQLCYCISVIVSVIVIDVYIISFIFIITSMYTSVRYWRNDVTTATAKTFNSKAMHVFVASSSNITIITA